VGGTSLAEFALNQSAGRDFYDVSLVDGYNLPIFINTINSSQPDPISANGCINRPASSGPSGCMSDVNAACPQELQVKNSSGQVIACTSACIAFKTDQYCCTGAYGSTSTCDHTAWPVDYAYNIFKEAQPYAYSYAFDDASSTFSCLNCNYRITFGLPLTNAQPSVNPAVTPMPTTVIPTFNCIGTIPCVPTLMPSPGVLISSMPNQPPALSGGPVISTQPIATQPGSPLPSITGPQSGNSNVVGFVKFILCYTYILPFLFTWLGIDWASVVPTLKSLCSNI
jgi:hypothetical protein